MGPLSREGSFKIPSVGLVYLSGLTLKQAENRVKSKLSRFYSGLVSAEGKEQNTFCVLTLGKVRTLGVYVVGEVRKPGSYILPAYASSLDGLYRAGGPALSGTFRNIRLIRRGKEISRLDVYDYFRNGNPSSQVRLQDLDVIVVDVYGPRVSLEGGFKLAKIFEIKEKESLADLLDYAGGFKASARQDCLRIRRLRNSVKKIFTVCQKDYEKFILEGGDLIIADTIRSDFLRQVEIQGAVESPGTYEWKSGLKITDLLEKASGLSEGAFLLRVLVHRRIPDGRTQVFGVHLGKIMSGEAADVELQEGDRVEIRFHGDILPEEQVFIEGGVGSPGAYPYYKGMTVEDLVLMAGGLGVGAEFNRVEIAHIPEGANLQAEVNLISIKPDLSIQKAAFGVPLRAYDRVSIRRVGGWNQDRRVLITGAVRYPGYYVLQSTHETLSEMVNRAGGLVTDAYPKGGYVLRTFSENIFNKDSLSLQTQNARSYLSVRVEKALGKNSSKHNVVLRPGDILHIPKTLQEVRVRGAVLNPTAIMYQSSYSFKDYVRMAGGYKQSAYPRGAYINYPNGSSRTPRNFLFFKIYPRVEPGSVIEVPLRPFERYRLSPQEWVALGSGMGTLALLALSVLERSQGIGNN
ncbi:MAG: SLBB domain-containing protein [Cytophagales bacterium]|nr:SLBB domain-containing protein [Cytophagales bacterium]